MMATYYSGSGSDMQAAADGGSNNIQTLYLMNPNFSSPYHPSSSPPPPPNMLLYNQQPHALNPSSLPHAPPILSPSQHQHLLGIPLVGSSSPQPQPLPQQEDLIRPSPSSTALYGGLVPRVQYNLWAAAAAAAAPSLRDDHSSQAYIPTAIAVTAGGVDVDVAGPASIGFFRRPPPPHISVSTAANTQPLQLQSQQGGLSLSLSNSNNNNNNSPRINSKAAATTTTTTTTPTPTESVVLGSKYLKPVQELLDEVVSAVNLNQNFKRDYKSKSTALGGGESSTTTGGKNMMMIASSGGSGDESSTAALQRQRLQINKANLLNMLDEVDRRYKQYHSQMQTVVSSFERAAGPGSASCYTALALGTISRQFRSLKDAVASQLKATTNALGPEVAVDDHQRPLLDVSGSSISSSSKRRGIRLVDYPNHNPWRPQRGLPERAVSVLRAWLFEHFLHPYPKDGDKHMLAKQTGLTRSQVSNWFINARVRLWKPMVEEMYLEETKAQQQNADDDGHSKNQNDSITPNVNNINSNINSPTANLQPFTSLLHSHLNNNTNSSTSLRNTTSSAQLSPEPALAHTTSVTPTTTTFQGFSMIRPSSEMDSIFIDPKRPRSSVDMHFINSPNSIISSMETEMKPAAPDQLFTTGPTTRTAPIQGPGSGGLFGGSYPFGEIGPRFDDNDPTDHQLAGQGSSFLQGNGGNVSLTLGLPNQQLSHPRQHHHGGSGGFISSAHNNIQLGSRRAFAGEMETEEDSATDHHFCGISTSVSAAGQGSQSVGGGEGGGGGGGFDWIDLQNRKRFAAVQLLSDFVT